MKTKGGREINPADAARKKGAGNIMPTRQGIARMPRCTVCGDIGSL
jgi:hypothetical protein